MLLVAVGQREDRPANMLGQVRPSVDEAGQLSRQFGPVCATSVQPGCGGRRKYLRLIALQRDVLGRFIRLWRMLQVVGEPQRTPRKKLSLGPATLNGSTADRGVQA